MPEVSSATSPIRYRQLDALRGIAAIVVVIGHMATFVNVYGNTGLFRTPLSPYITGQAAVILFFVLSGFVLAVPFLTGSNQSYFPYVARRMCRLYLPAAVAVLTSIALLSLLHMLVAVFPSGGEPSTWNEPLSFRLLMSDLLMIGFPFGGVRLNPPTWSLIVEIRASLLFPFLMLLGLRLRWLGLFLMIAVALASARVRTGLGDTSPIGATSALGSVLLTGRYLVFFCSASCARCICS